MHILQRILGCSLSLLMFQVNAKETLKDNYAASKQPFSFIENKGQIIDQNGKHRNDIDYKLEANGMTMFVGDAQLHYQWSRSPLPASPKGEVTV